MSAIIDKSLWDVIQEKIVLGSENARGWYAVKCAVCNDYQERGGFIHDDIYTSYSCWNCQSKFKYEEGSGKFSKNLRDILEAFGVTKNDLQPIRSSLFFNKKLEQEQQEISLKELARVKLITPEVAFPDRTLALGCDGYDEIQAPLIEYLNSRGIDPLKYQIHFSLDPKYLRRVIIPFLRDGKLIYWQARTIDNVKPRYLNCVVSKDAVLYGYDELTKFSQLPLFATEGVFDAMPINGICILGSSLNAAKIEILKRTKRRIIFVIDRDVTGNSLAETVIQNGWEFTFVDKNADDVNDSIKKFGLQYTVYSLIKNAFRDNPNDQFNKAKAANHLGLEMLEARLRSRR